MTNTSESKQLVEAAKKEIYKSISMAICMAPCAVGMSLYRFRKEIAPYWGKKPDSIKRDLTRGVPAKLTFSQITFAIEQVYQSYIATVPQEKLENIVQAHSKFYPYIFQLIEDMYKLIGALDKRQSWAEHDIPLWKQELIRLFLSGKITTGFTAKEAEWLREALLDFPPNGIELLNKTEERQPIS